MKTVQYQVGGSLMGDASSYVVRQADELLYQALLRQEFCYVLNARQMGKSSLMVRARERLQQQGYRCVTLDLTNIGSENITPLQWYKGIIKDLWRSFKLRRQVKINDWWQEETDVSLLQRLSYFIGDVLLKQLPNDNLVIFIDEIDSILSLPFSVDDFFALIRFCYNQRATDPRYQRINFVILGVATPSDLIRDRTRTPFNIGTPIELEGLSLENSQPLAEGLTIQEGSKQAVLKEILYWTQGQPFLTQKLCQLAISSSRTAVSGGLTIPPGSESYWVEQLVADCVLKEWESQDEPEHLRTIRNRILNNPETVGRLLGLYQRLLGDRDPVQVDDSREQIELVLAGIAVRQNGNLAVKNPIYARVFNHSWVEQQLSSLRPYAQGLKVWLASGKVDESRLLRGQALKDAQIWAQGKRLSDEDYQFLAASVESDRQAVQQAAEAKRIQFELAQEQQTSKLQRRFLSAVSAAFFMALGFGAITFGLYRRTQISEIKAIATAAEGRFESHNQLDALQQIITAQTKLNRLIRPPEAQTYRVRQVLQRLVDGIEAKNQINLPAAVRALALHPDGEQFAIVTADGALSLWQVTGERMDSPNLPTQTVTSAAFSPDGQTLVLLLSKETVEFWRWQDNQITEKIRTVSDLPLRPHKITFSTDGQHLLLQGERTEPQRLNLQTLEWHSFNASAPISHAASHPQNNLIAGLINPPPLRIFPDSAIPRHLHGMPPPPRPSGASGRPKPPKFPGHLFSPPPPPTSPQKIGDQPRFSGFRRTALIHIWNADGDTVAELEGSQPPKGAIAIQPQGKLIAVATNKGAIDVINLDGTIEKTLPSQGALVQALTFSADGRWVAAADADSMVYLWDTTSNSLQHFEGHQGTIRQLQFDPEGRWLASASEDGTVRLWQLHHPLRTTLAASGPGTQRLFYVGDALHAVSTEQELRIWQNLSDNGDSRQPDETFSVAIGSRRALVSQSGDLIAAITHPQKFIVTDRLRDTSQHLFVEGTLTHGAFAPSGDLLLAGGPSDRLYLWFRQPTGEFTQAPNQTLTIPGINVVSQIALNHQIDRLAIGTPDGEIHLFQLTLSTDQMSAQLEPQARLDAHPSDVSQLQFSPDGQWLASSGRDNKIQVWDTTDDSLSHTLEGHETLIQAIAFSADSQRLASSSTDTVKLWQINSPQAAQHNEQELLLRTLTGHKGEVNALAFSPDGTELASAGSDRKINVWKIQDILALDELDHACTQVQDYLQHNQTVEESDRNLCR